MSLLCKYSNIFGRPEEGIHSYRIAGISVVDTLLTLIVAYIIAQRYRTNIVGVMAVLVVLSAIIHKLFCVQTTLTKKLDTLLKAF